MNNNPDPRSKLKLRLCGIAATLISVGALSYWYSLGYVTGHGGKTITAEIDPVEFYISIIFMVFSGALGLSLALGIYPRNQSTPIIPPQKEKTPPVSRTVLLAQLRSVGTKRAILFIILAPILLITAQKLDIHWIIAVAALLIISSILDHLIFSKLFRCPSCNAELWSYTTRRLKVRKLTLLPGVSGCPKCGVSFL